MLEWERWKKLTSEQQDYERHRILVSLEEKVDKISDSCPMQKLDCDETFAKKSDVKETRSDIDYNKHLIHLLLSGFFIVIVVYVVGRYIIGVPI